MGWTTTEENIEVISQETVEDKDPKLYRKRAKVLAEQGMYDEADMEYDKSIQYGNNYSFLYIGKSLFWLRKGKNGRSILALLMLVWKFFYRNIDIGLLYILIFIFSINSDGEIKGMPSIIVSVVVLAILIKRIIRISKFIRDEFPPKISLGQHIVNTIVGIICAFAVFFFVPFVFLLGYIPVIGVMFAINFLAVLFKGVRKILPKQEQQQANKVSQPQQDILPNQQKVSHRENPAVGMVEGMLFTLDAPIQKGRECLDKFAAEKNIDFTKRESTNTASPDNTQQKPKQETKQTDKTFQKENLLNQQEVRQREKSSMGAVGGMLLVLDVPIQRGKLFLDKFLVEKNIVTILVNGNNMQVDVSCKRIETKPDTDFGQCERYDIKKDTVVYVLVAVILYCINIWGKEWDGNTESACEKLTAQLNQKLNPYGVRTRLSEKGWHFLENSNLITFEDVIFILRNKKA